MELEILWSKCKPQFGISNYDITCVFKIPNKYWDIRECSYQCWKNIYRLFPSNIYDVEWDSLSIIIFYNRFFLIFPSWPPLSLPVQLSTISNIRRSFASHGSYIHLDMNAQISHFTRQPSFDFSLLCELEIKEPWKITFMNGVILRLKIEGSQVLY